VDSVKKYGKEKRVALVQKVSMLKRSFDIAAKRFVLVKKTSMLKLNFVFGPKK
jgi:hypothetical protein